MRPDYDDDPGRWGAWESPQDVHDMVAPELAGPVLDVGCGEGRLRSLLADRVPWVGLDYSAAQLAANPWRPVVRGDMGRLPFADSSFAEVAHLWCLYHVEEPREAIREAARVLRPGGRYFACTSARDNDPELAWEGYPPSPFDAEKAAGMVASVFGVSAVKMERWDGQFFPLATVEEVRAYCRHNLLPIERADEIEVPLWLTKRGVLVRAVRSEHTGGPPGD